MLCIRCLYIYTSIMRGVRECGGFVTDGGGGLLQYILIRIPLGH